MTVRMQWTEDHALRLFSRHFTGVDIGTALFAFKLSLDTPSRIVRWILHNQLNITYAQATAYMNAYRDEIMAQHERLAWRL